MTNIVSTLLVTIDGTLQLNESAVAVRHDCRTGFAVDVTWALLPPAEGKAPDLDPLPHVGSDKAFRVTVYRVEGCSPLGSFAGGEASVIASEDLVVRAVSTSQKRPGGVAYMTATFAQPKAKDDDE